MSGPDFRALAREAAARYPERERFTRRWAYGKLAGDPVYRHVIENALIPRDARVLDLGCGIGLLAALLAAGNSHGDYRYRGIDVSDRDIARARAAARPGDALEVRDIRAAAFGVADVAILIDAVHYLEPEAQLDALHRVRASLSGGGVLLLRVADPSRGFAYRLTEALDLFAMRMRGLRIRRLHSVAVAERVRQLEAEGFRVEARPMSSGTPFANVLLVARV